MIVWRPLRGFAWRLLPQAKAGVAAGLSWWLSQLLFGSSQPYFAPLAAILTMQVTVSDSVTFGGQRILGVIGGVAVSLAAAHWLRPSALGVALLVFAGMGIASVVGLANVAVAQVGISGLLVLALGNRPEYAAARHAILYPDPVRRDDRPEWVRRAQERRLAAKDYSAS